MNLVLDTTLFNLLCQKQCVGGGGANNGALHVLHHLKLFVGVAWAHGYSHCAKLFRSGLEADSCGPKAISRSNLDAVLVGDAGKLIAAGEHGCPVLHVLFCIRNDDRKSCGT